jgi:hypothetical protein
MSPLRSRAANRPGRQSDRLGNSGGATAFVCIPMARFCAARRSGGVNGSGNSQISAEEFGIRIAGLGERGGHARERVTIVW